MDIANEYNYTVLLIEPRTSFKFDSAFLATSNKHNVSYDVIEAKRQQFQLIVPFYFAWFLNETESHKLIETAKTALTNCFENLTFFKKDFISDKKIGDPLKEFKFKKSELHCTTKYVGSKKVANTPENVSYYENLTVAESMGRAFKLTIVGFCISKYTVSAIVSLSNLEQKTLWQNNLTDKDKAAIITDPFYENKDIDRFIEKLEYGGNNFKFFEVLKIIFI